LFVLFHALWFGGRIGWRGFFGFTASRWFDPGNECLEAGAFPRVCLASAARILRIGLVRAIFFASGGSHSGSSSMAVAQVPNACAAVWAGLAAKN